MIRTPPPRYTRPELYTKQYRAIYSPERYAVVEASTKTGKTVGCMTWLLEQALHGSAGHHYWWCAPTYTVARIAYERYKRQLEVRDPVSDRQIGATYRDAALQIVLPNGALLDFKSMEKPDNLYGEDVYAAVIDEATRCREESWFAVRSTLTATGGPIRIIGNVKGRKNWAYRLARLAESGERGYAYAKLTAYDAVRAGIITRAEVEDARVALPDHVFRQLYLAEPADDEGNPFGMDAIRACVAPLSSFPPVVWGWDFGKWQDWTVGIALDARGHTCRVERWQRDWDVTLSTVKAKTLRTPAWVDATHGSVGDPLLSELQGTLATGTNYHGVTFTTQTKQQLMDGLKLALSARAVHYPDGPIKDELETFEYTYTATGVRYSAPEGLHDDCVTALALAVYGRSQLPPASSLYVGHAAGWSPRRR